MSRPLYGGRQFGGRVAGLSQLGPPAGQEVFDHRVLLFVPGGPGGHRARLVGGVPADGGVDLGRAGGVHLPGLFRDAGDGETAQTPRGTGVGLDAIAQLHRFGGSRQAADGGGGVQVVSQQGRVEPFPAAPR